ncbi:MAG: hypothetical protein ACOYXC_18510 [Candidatus Rifleibacteriota bacterium]
MQFKKINLLGIIALLVASTAIMAQDASRWQRIPYHGSGRFVRNPLHNHDQPGVVFPVVYEKQPVRPLLRMIRKNFPELSAPKRAGESLPATIDMSQSALLLQNLQAEADFLLKTASETISAASPTRSLF